MIEVQLLGPLEVVTGGASLPLGTPKQQAVLAMLATRPGRLVSLDELVDELWPTDPPPSAVANTRSYAANLRRTLDSAGSTKGVLVRRASGYELRVPPENVDLIGFTAEHRQAGEALARGDIATAADLLARAGARWRGPMLAGVPLGPALSVCRAAAEEQRLSLTEQRAELHLATGQPRSAIVLLRDHLQAHPLRERGHALLIRALYQDGDAPGALAAFSVARSTLVEQLGIEPGTELRQLHQAVLRREVAPYRPRPAERSPRLDAARPSARGAPPEDRDASPAAPTWWLPRPVPDFTGRADAVRRLVELAERSDPTGPVVQVVDGMAGSGKTTLAVHVATRLADRYPDAQLFVDLRGHSANNQLEPAAALVTLLRQLGVAAGRIPPELEHRTALWRSELAARRAVVVLDNAASSSQIGPLLPSAPGTLVLVTSRRRLLGLGSAPESLAVLTAAEAVDLLAKIAGRERIAAEPESAATLVRCCGHLPLAIRMAGARLAHRPAWRVADLAGRLDRGAPVLAELSAEDQTVAGAFTLSYEPLPEPVRRTFRLLGLYPGEFFRVTAVAALTGLPLPEAESAIAELVDHHLVDEPSAGRFRLHDLLRQYAHDLVTTAESADQRRRAVEELLDHYLQLAVSVTDIQDYSPPTFTVKLGRPHRPDLVRALVPVDSGWLEAERSNLRALVRLAARSGHDHYTWRLARAAWRFNFTRGYFDDILETHAYGLESAERLRDDFAIAAMHNYVASAHGRVGNYDKALSHVETAIEYRQRVGDTDGVMTGRGNLAVVYWLLGRVREAVEMNEEVTGYWNQRGKMPAAASFNQGMFLTQAGEYERALRLYRRHLQTGCEQGDTFTVANTLGKIGGVRLRMGQTAAPLRLLRASLALRRRAGHHYGEAEVRNDLGTLLRQLGDLAEAEHQHRVGLEVAIASGERHVESAVLNGLGLTLAAKGQWPAALEAHRRALELATRISHPYEQGRALAALGSHLRSQDPAEARRHWKRALAIFVKMGVPERFEVERHLADLPDSAGGRTGS
ncbi:AfsR/SARP family transcriptional regulator [Plantactinospora sp. CA-290183]|uniref:AfsR/SARP family transcriptional regulator n=1 Tax=Plantactinospora sp. CA-290183 TaxID=3240006 RepID=UPI003D90CBCE